MSKYDSIKTAADLVAEVAAHGLSTDQDDINRAADIFGNTSIEELDRLANDIGRNNEKGEPDPNGSWSSSRKPTQETFYFIAFSIWHWQDATRFFNQHTNPDTKDHKVSKLESSLEAVTKDRDNTKAQLTDTADRAKEYAYKIDDLKADLQQKDTEIMALKAKLYDCMSVGA